MDTLNTHWTTSSEEDFLYRIAFDFIHQLEMAMDRFAITQADLANRIGVSEGRVSQVFNNPWNLTLKNMVRYGKAIGHKVSIVAYDDGDRKNANGPIPSEIFTRCWERCGRPTDYFE